MGAMSENFPNVNNWGCFFHFSQCLWRKVQEEGIQTRYSVDEVFVFEIKKIATLAFVPQIDVIDAFETLIQSPYYTEYEENLQGIIDYFDDVWIGRLTKRGNGRSPKFPIIMWNLYSTIQDGLPKTNILLRDGTKDLVNYFKHRTTQFGNSSK
ncbi:hypothetical protein SUGI_0967080 [Cryptomeria japonica]|nr:hypothetical protein SUGI_0967080 [Cryptomeria japonica]